MHKNGESNRDWKPLSGVRVEAAIGCVTCNTGPWLELNNRIVVMNPGKPAAHHLPSTRHLTDTGCGWILTRTR